MKLPFGIGARSRSSSEAVPPPEKPSPEEAKKDLQNEVAAPSLASIRQAWGDSSVVAGLTPVKLARILKAAAQGDAHDYLVLAEEMEERDPHYAAVLGTRKRAILGMDVQVEAASETARDKEIADEISKLVRKPAFEGLCADLLDGLGKGYSAVEIMWDRGKQWKPGAYKHRDAKWFRFDLDDARTLLLATEQNPLGEALPAYKFAVHTPRLKTGIPIRGGLARLVAWSFLFKNYSIKDWVGFMEAYGLPLRVGRYGPNASKEDKDALFRAVANIGTDAAAILPESMRIEFQEAMKGASSSDLFERAGRFFDQQISKAVLGQTMTTEDGASNSQAQVHDGVRVEISEDDAKQLAATINRDVIVSYVDLNYGPQEDYPQVSFQTLNEEELKPLVDAIGTLVDRGMRVSQRQMRDKLGLDDPDDDDEILTPANAGNPQSAPAPDDAAPAINSAFALNRDGQTELPPSAELDELQASDLADWQPMIDPLLAPIRDLVARSNTPQEVFEGLSKLLPDMDSGALATALAETLFKTRGQGQSPSSSEAVGHETKPSSSEAVGPG